MTQLFRASATTTLRSVLAVAVVLVAGTTAMAFAWSRSDAAWGVGKPADQPVPFRHDLHAGELSIACGYCHGSAERAASAGMPSAETCMTCHHAVWVGASALQPIRTSYELGQPIRWTSVNRLPDFAHFHHGAHVARGVTCATCHGDMAEQTKTVKAHSFSMGWCLDCHREPGRFIAPHEAADAADLPAGVTRPLPGLTESQLYEGGGPDLTVTDALRRRLTDCSTCHR